MKMDSVQKITEVAQVMAASAGKRVISGKQDLKSKVKESKNTDGQVRTKDVDNLDKIIEQSKKLFEENKEETASLQTIDQEKLRKIVEQLKQNLPNTEPKFGVHEETNKMMIKLVDKDTQKVVREYPLEKTLDQLAKNLELAGVMIDQKL